MRRWQVDLIIQMHCSAGRAVFQLCPLSGHHLGTVTSLPGLCQQIQCLATSRKVTSSSWAERLLPAKNDVSQDIITVK